MMEIELSMRFLDDFLRDDVYFGIHNEDDNLSRARTQIILAKDKLELFTYFLDS